MIKDGHIIALFKERDGLATNVKLPDVTLIVWNIAWGYDIGDEYAHVTTNISPDVVGAANDFFYTDEILEILDLQNNKVLFAKQ